MKTILAMVALLAAIASVYYAGYRAGQTVEKNKVMTAEHAAMIRFVSDYKRIQEAYDGQFKDLQKDTAPLAPSIASTLNRLPEPSSKPRR